MVLLALSAEAVADRQLVLRQIDVPHHYYYREMYLPQLTSGPSSLSWAPDGTSLVYSMQGSLWRQAVDSDLAEQLTAGPGYDYQPDWSPDGRQIVFARYDRDAIELKLLDLASATVTSLTDEGAVNVEPRWSPDGRRIAFVSTKGTGRFHVFTGELTDGRFQTTQLVAERESRVPRYYYSRYDHQVSPSWSPDGEALIYVSNPEIPYGSGAIWRHSLTGEGQVTLVRKEETTWRAKPDWAPDGGRIVYASYLGRQWHQLWATTIDGVAEPFPLTYGDFDVSAPRWSPDARRIAYVVNESGNTEIRIQELVGGATRTLNVADRRYRVPMSSLALRIRDADGNAAPARVSVIGADGRSYAPQDSWIHADYEFDRRRAEFETHYFHLHGEATLALPPGPTNVTVWHGPEHSIQRSLINVSAERDNRLTVELKRLDLPDAWNGWVGGDTHVHMNYGGAYRNTPERLVAQAAAEDLDVVFNLVVNKEQRIPDIAYFSVKPDSASTDDVLLLHGQEFHTIYWGHLGLLGLGEHLLLPDYSAYPGTAAASIFPDNVTVAGLAHEQGALVGYVHPFYAAPDPGVGDKLTNALPVDAALGLVDFYEVVGFADHRASAEVWYRLLNCNMKIAAAGGTDAMANYASLRGPVGLNRVYVPVDSGAQGLADRRDAWLAGLKSGRAMATNGPLLGFSVNGNGPGSELKLPDGQHELRYDGFLRSAVPVDHLELVHNGAVVETFDSTEGGRTADLAGVLQIETSGWLLLRAWNDTSHPLVFDVYPYATTSPVYVSVGGKAVRSASDADYFLAWIKRVRESVDAHEAFNNVAERETILANLQRAERVYAACR